MGQQQLLLIVLGVIIVGIAVIIAIALFRANAIENKRDLVLSESLNIATNAQTYYKKPAPIGGGGGTFDGWDIPSKLKITPAGYYEADIQSDQVVIIGTGNEVVSGNDSVKVQLTVFSDSIATLIIH